MLEEYRDEFVQLLQHISHTSDFTLELNSMAVINILVVVTDGFRLIIVVIGTVISTLTFVELDI